MKRSVLISFILVLGFCGIRAAEDVDFTDIDLILQAPLKRHERSPDYGAGLGGPLAANGAPPGTAPGGAKPAAAPPPPPPPPPPPTTKATTKAAPATTKAQATTKKAGSGEKTTKAPTAATKAPAKQEKSDKNGEDIANQLYNHPNECKDPKDGGVWAPLPNGQTCGSDGNCPYPQKWCSAKQEGSSSSNPKLSCQDLPPECQKALAGESAATTAAAPPAGDTTTSGQTTTTAATTKASTGASSQKPTTKASSSGGTTTPPSANCNDNHPYCCFWADDKQGRPSECDRNSKWMKSQCGKSCGTCGCTTGDCPTKVNTAGCQWTQGGGNGQGRKTRIMLSGGQPFGPLGGGSPGGAGTGAAGPSPAGGGNPGSPGGGSSTMTKIFIGKK